MTVTVDNYAVDGGVTSYNGFSSGSTAFNVPGLIYQTSAGVLSNSLQIQNLGSQTANVTIEYYKDGLTLHSRSLIIAPNASFNQVHDFLDQDVLHSAVVNSSQPIIAIQPI
jgi:hypothetical protein